MKWHSSVGLTCRLKVRIDMQLHLEVFKFAYSFEQFWIVFNKFISYCADGVCIINSSDDIYQSKLLCHSIAEKGVSIILENIELGICSAMWCFNIALKYTNDRQSGVRAIRKDLVAALSCGLGVSMLNTALLIIFTAAPESIKAVTLVPFILICVWGCCWHVLLFSCALIAVQTHKHPHCSMNHLVCGWCML